MQYDNTYYSIFMNAVEGIFQSTPDGQYLNVNPSLANMYGYDSPDDLMGHINNIASQLYVNPDRRQQFIDEMHTNGIVKDFVSQIYRKDKSVIWISENVRIVRDDKGAPQYYEGFVTNITALKKAEARNAKLQSRLQQAAKLETIGTMANGIAHDFNNILTPIIGYAELMEEMAPQEGPFIDFVKRIVLSAKRGKDLIQEIHTFGQPNPQNMLPVHIDKIIDEVVLMLLGSTIDDVVIHQDVQENVSAIQGDATQMHQILLNLCTNAMHAMENTGGELWIKLRERSLSKSDIEHKMLGVKPGKYVKLSIKDSGAGIPPQIMNKIFDPYFTTKGKGKGTGLGLATVHSIVKNYQGEVVVKSTPGKGTTFQIYIPVLNAKSGSLEAELLASTNKASEMSSKAKEILLVDDDADVLQAQGQIIERLGYKVSMFQESLQALESFQNHPEQYDLVLTDMQMPDMNGVELSKALLDIKPSLPVILCTAFSARANEDTIKAIGISKLLFKPLLINDLRQVIAELLQPISNVSVVKLSA